MDFSNFFSLIQSFLFVSLPFPVQMAIEPITLALLGGAALAGGTGLSLFGQSKAKKAAQQASEATRRGFEQGEQALARLIDEASGRIGFTPEEMETARLGRRRTIEDATAMARERLMQGLSQRGLLRSGILARQLGGLEQQRLSGIDELERALQFQNIAQRRADLGNIQGLRLNQAQLLTQSPIAIQQPLLAAALGNAQALGQLGGQFAGLGGSLLGSGLGSGFGAGAFQQPRAQ